MSNTDSESLALYIAWSSQRDRTALERLLTLKLPLVYRVAIRFLRDSHDAEDVTQQVLLKFSTVPPGSIHDLDRWLYVATDRAASDLIRSAGAESRQAGNYCRTARRAGRITALIARGGRAPLYGVAAAQSRERSAQSA